MATFYLDFENGNDTNNGSSWALAWKTITSGATAARIAPGDTIKIAKTADPVSLGQNATFTDGSQTVTLTSAVTKKIDDATASDWTVSTNITQGTNTNRKVGSAALILTPGAAFTTGKVAYKAISGGGTQDFSSYQKISFWYRPTTSTVIADATYKICLCSDATGDTIVNEINIPATLASSAGWRSVTLDYGGALSSSVQSVAIYANSDPGTTPFSINNIFATNDLTLDTLIGPSGDVNYCIQSIDDTTIKIDSNNNSAIGRGYSGSAGTETIYYQQPWFPTDGTGIWETIQDTGSETGGRIIYSGGWNTSSGLQDGYTVVAGTTVGLRTAISVNNKKLITFENFKLARMSVCFQTAGAYFTVNNCIFAGNASPLNLSGPSQLVVTNSKILNSSSFNYFYPGQFINCEFRNASQYGYACYANQFFTNCTFANNTTAGIGITAAGLGDFRSNVIVLKDCIINDTTEVYYFASNFQGAWVTAENLDQTPGNHYMWSYYVVANWQTAVYQGSDPGAWKINISNQNVSSIAPAKFPLGEVACKANETVTYSIWVKKDHATNIQAKLVIEDETLTLPGITEQTDTKADDTNWEQLTVSFTPTQKGVVRPYLYCWYNGGTSNVYVGSRTIT